MTLYFVASFNFVIVSSRCFWSDFRYVCWLDVEVSPLSLVQMAECACNQRTSPKSDAAVAVADNIVVDVSFAAKISLADRGPELWRKTSKDTGLCNQNCSSDHDNYTESSFITLTNVASLPIIVCHDICSVVHSWIICDLSWCRHPESLTRPCASSSCKMTMRLARHRNQACRRSLSSLLKESRYLQ